MFTHRCAACALVLLALLICPLMAEEPVGMPPPDVPGATATWNSGHWFWTGSEWSWIPGCWQITRPTAAARSTRWVDGQWMPGANGMVWVPGHYEGGAPAGAADAGATVETVAPERVAVVEAAPEVVVVATVEQPVCVEARPYGAVVVRRPVCLAPEFSVSMSLPGPRCLPVPVPVPQYLPAPSLRPLAAIAHHATDLGRLPFFNPLFFLHR